MFLFLPSLKEQLYLPLRQADLQAAWKRLWVLYLFPQNAPSSQVAYKAVR